MMAENDLVLGKMIEAISHSRFWKQTAVFVVEDDAQNGPDHVDCHRTVALVASPYVRRHSVDSTMYSTSSMLRTMELILGLPPLTQYDAAATPMWATFQQQSDLRPYDCLAARVPLDKKLGWGFRCPAMQSIDLGGGGHRRRHRIQRDLVARRSRAGMFAYRRER